MGPPSTFEQLYDDHFDYAFQLARLFCAPPGHEEDVAQEVFLTLYQRMRDERFSATGSPRPWLRTAAYWKARDFRRACFLRRRDGRGVGERGFDLADRHVQADVEGWVALREDRALLFSFLEELEDKRQVVFVLHDILGHTFTE